MGSKETPRNGGRKTEGTCKETPLGRRQANIATNEDGTFRQVDKHANPLEVGDRIRVLGFRSSIVDTKTSKTRTILEQCVGRVFSISDVQKDWVAIEVGKFVGTPAWQETIYIEPEHWELASKKKPRIASAHKRRSKRRAVIK
jgi:hypothetical protein